MKRTKPTGRPMLRNVMTGALAGMLGIVAGSLIGAYMLHKEIVGIGGVGYISVIVLLLAAFLGAVIGGRGMTGKERLLWGSVSGGVMFVLMLICNIAFFEGRFSGVVVTAMMIAACSLCAFLLFGRNGKKKKYRIPKL